MPRRATPELFWSKINKGSQDDCWLWMAGTDEHGYGRMRYQRKEWAAHRLAWALTNGNPGKLFVCHKCDNTGCCNPSHLFLGTQKDNMKDSAAKGRHPRNKKNYLPRGEQHHSRLRPEVMARGERNAAAVLTTQKVRNIRRKRESGRTLMSLAEEYGVAKGTITFIVQRKTWRHI